MLCLPINEGRCSRESRSVASLRGYTWEQQPLRGDFCPVATWAAASVNPGSASPQSQPQDIDVSAAVLQVVRDHQQGRGVWHREGKAADEGRVTTQATTLELKSMRNCGMCQCDLTGGARGLGYVIRTVSVPLRAERSCVALAKACREWDAGTGRWKLIGTDWSDVCRGGCEWDGEPTASVTSWYHYSWGQDFTGELSLPTPSHHLSQSPDTFLLPIWKSARTQILHILIYSFVCLFYQLWERFVILSCPFSPSISLQKALSVSILTVVTLVISTCNLTYQSLKLIGVFSPEICNNLKTFLIPLTSIQLFYYHCCLF